MLLSLAGHLFVTGFVNRWFAHRAVEASFMLKAEGAAAENPAQMNGYAAAVHAMTSGGASWPGIDPEVPPPPRPLEVAQFLPSTLHRAFAAADPALMSAGALGEANLNPPESDRSAFERAKQDAAQAARKLIDAALSDTDGILGAYLNGQPPSSPPPGGPAWAAGFSTPVGDLMLRRPDLFRAAAENRKAMRAIWEAGQNDPWQKNIRRMMGIAMGIQSYAQDHQNAYPESIEALFESAYLKAPLEAKSLLTGRPYVYVAAGEKRPVTVNKMASLVLLYDDDPGTCGAHPCVFATGGGSAIRPDDLKEQLKKRGKTELP
jgi:hypothetical protein